MASDVAREILKMSKQPDRESRFVILARNYGSVILKVTAPVENGQHIFKISYHESLTGEQWETVTYSYSDIEGAVGFVDGFMRKKCRCEKTLWLIPTSRVDDNPNPNATAEWEIPNDLACEEECSLQRLVETRMMAIRAALKALLTP